MGQQGADDEGPGTTRWSPQTARAALLAQEASGESVMAFARRHGLQKQRLFWWLSCLGARARGSERSAGLVPAIISSAPVLLRGAGEAQVALRVGEVRINLALPRPPRQVGSRRWSGRLGAQR